MLGWALIKTNHEDISGALHYIGLLLQRTMGIVQVLYVRMGSYYNQAWELFR